MKDIFSEQAEGYARFRPQYPAALYDFIMKFVKGYDLAWDCGTGNGQTAVQLSRYFKRVYATDISKEQLEQAAKKEKVIYAVEAAEEPSLEPGSVDLVTVSQALHWFDLDRYYTAVKLVAKPGAVMAAWTYSLLHIDDDVDELIHHFHYETLKDHWQAERKYVDDGYGTIPFPFHQIDTPPFNIMLTYSLCDLEGYLQTWSAVQKFKTAEGYDPVLPLMNEISKLWDRNTKSVIFPIHLKIAYVHTI